MKKVIIKRVKEYSEVSNFNLETHELVPFTKGTITINVILPKGWQEWDDDRLEAFEAELYKEPWHYENNGVKFVIAEWKDYPAQA